MAYVDKSDFKENIALKAKHFASLDGTCKKNIVTLHEISKAMRVLKKDEKSLNENFKFKQYLKFVIIFRTYWRLHLSGPLEKENSESRIQYIILDIRGFEYRAYEIHCMSKKKIKSCWYAEVEILTISISISIHQTKGKVAYITQGTNVQLGFLIIVLKNSWINLLKSRKVGKKVRIQKKSNCFLKLIKKLEYLLFMYTK